MTWVAVGTAAAIGAASGAGIGIIQGKSTDEVLKGALIGGATGALTGGAGAALGSAGSTAGSTLTTEAASQLAPELVSNAAVNAVPLDTVVQQAVPEVASAGINQITPEMMNAVNLGSADAIAAQGTGTQVAGPAMNVAPTPPPPAGAPPANVPAPETVSNFGIKGVGPDPSAVSPLDTGVKPMIQGGNPAYPSTMGQLQSSVTTPIAPSGPVTPTPSSNPFMEGFASVKDFVKSNPLESAVIGYAGLTALDSFGSKEDPRKKRTYTNKYPISPNFQPSRPEPNVYQPRYAEGGITSFDDEAGIDQFAAGGSTRKERDADADFKRYYSMMNARPEVGADEEALRKPRFARDDDADTRYENALAAAMIRQKKNNARANISSPSVKRPTPLGTLNLAPPGTRQAAAGGIMGYSLGGYAAGGNPRLLKGPGDGMSDNIPAVIGSKQPARLADGEFVVPADVVSHLGNGSTDAGAKKLHQMMDRIRTDRTGKKKQAPAVNADKYLPGKKKAAGGIADIAGYAEGGVLKFENGGVTYNAQLAANVQAAYNQGYSGSQIGAALIASGVSPETAAAATGLSSGVISQVYAGGAALTAGGGGIGPAAGNPGNPNPTSAPYTPGVVTPTPVTPTPVTPAPVVKDINAYGPGGYKIPFFPPEAIASYIKEQKITTPEQFKQVQSIFNVSDAQIAEAQGLIKNNPTLVDATTAKYYADIKANPAQEAQNARDFAARAAQLGIKDLLVKPTPIVPINPEVTPESTTTTGPIAGSAVYRPGFVPRATGVNTSIDALDPYSNKGLADLYNQMMQQYNKPKAPMSDVEVKALAEEAYKSGSGAEVGRALINAGIPVNQAISSLKSYAGLTPDIVNQAYIGGQSLGVTPPATLDTQYTYSDPATYYRPPAVNNSILTKPVVDAAFKAPADTGYFAAPDGKVYTNEAAYNAAVAPAQGGKAGGLMSIKHKKRRA
jgi:hypothetical protein